MEEKLIELLKRGYSIEFKKVATQVELIVTYKEEIFSRVLAQKHLEADKILVELIYLEKKLKPFELIELSK